MMERRRLAPDLDVPVIGLGTYRVFNVKGDAARARCEAVVDAALEHRANLFDSSPMYGEAEAVLAEALRDRRDEAIVATKVWAKTRAIGEQQVELALDMYGWVDLYQIHNLLEVADHMPYLEQQKRAGRVKAIGATHYLTSALPEIIQLIRDRKVDAVQVPYHPSERAIEEELLPAAHAHGVGVIVMSPLEAGRAFATAPSRDELTPLAEYGIATWAQALLKWILSDMRITCAIPATSSPDHMRENASAGTPPWLDDDARDYVSQLALRR